MITPTHRSLGSETKKWEARESCTTRCHDRPCGLVHSCARSDYAESDLSAMRDHAGATVTPANASDLLKDAAIICKSSQVVSEYAEC